MTIIKTKDIVNSLMKKGFRSREGDHTFFILYVDGKKTSIRTKISHGKREIDCNLIKIMANQLRLEKNEFIKFVDCALNLDRYIQILAKNGLTFN